MSTTSKSPRKVALVALAVAEQTLPAYSHRFSPKLFTQPQLFACLAIKTFFRTDYRGVTGILADLPELCQAIGLVKVPHFTTLQKAARRLMASPISKKILEGTIRQALGERPRVNLAAVDSTGMESHHISRYFVRRRASEESLWKTMYYTKYPKLAIVCDCQSHIILSTLRKRGPTHDINQLRQTLRPAVGRAKIEVLLADAGYDSEANHRFTREELGIETIIPARHGRPSKRPPTGKYRRLMREEFDKERYGQRWQVETVFSMIKRNLGSALHGRSYWSQCRELMLLAITHNIMIIMPAELFYRAGQNYFIFRTTNMLGVFSPGISHFFISE